MSWVEALRREHAVNRPPAHAQTVAQLAAALGIADLRYEVQLEQIHRIAKERKWRTQMWGRLRYYWPQESAP